MAEDRPRAGRAEPDGRRLRGDSFCSQLTLRKDGARSRPAQLQQPATSAAGKRFLPAAARVCSPALKTLRRVRDEEIARTAPPQICLTRLPLPAGPRAPV